MMIRIFLSVSVWVWLICAVMFVPPRAEAIGPRTVISTGEPVKWQSIPVTIHVESDLDVRGRDISSLVTEALNMWADLTESDVVLTAGSLGVAVDQTNICTYFYDSRKCPSGPTNDGTNPLVIDDDGEIMGDFFGSGNKLIYLGFASIPSSNASTGGIVKGEAVFSTACLTGVEVDGCAAAGFSFSDDDITSFMVHELGHFLGLDHSQVNLIESEDDDASNDGFITTMFPVFIPGNGTNFKSPERDDQVALAQLYPASGFASSTWTLTGTVISTDGTELQCANLVARNASNPRGDAISALSGDFVSAGTADGSFEILGLTAGSSYSLTVESIPTTYEGSSGYTPCRGSNGEAGPPQFTSLTSTSTFTASAGGIVQVICTISGDCLEDGSDDDGSVVSGGGSGGGCSLIP